MESKFPLVLPYGVMVDGELVRDFSLRKVDGVFEKIYTHKKYAAKFPQSWMGRVVSAVLQSVGTTDVRAKFKESDYEKIPEIVTNMTIHDLSYILMMGHINTYGSKIDSLKYECSSCSFSGVMGLDLEDIQLRDFSVAPLEQEVVADLSDGWVAPPTAKSSSLQAGTVFNRFKFKMPQLKHAIASEAFYSAKNVAEFNLMIAQNAITEVSFTQVDPKTKALETVRTMDSEDVSIYRRRLVLDLQGADRRDIRRAFKDCNPMKLSVMRSCDKCDTDMEIEVGVENLYPLA